MDTVLIPRAAIDSLPTNLEAATIGYGAGPPSPVLRLRARLGWAAPTDLLAARLGLALADPALDRVMAFWLAPGAYVARAHWDLLLDLLPALRWLYAQSAGTDALPLDLLAARGVAVSTTADLNTRAVAEAALACLLAEAKQLPAHHEAQRRQRWQARDGRMCVDLKVGIVGTGRIGTSLAGMCRALGMGTVGFSRMPERLTGGPWDEVADLGDGFAPALAGVDALVLAMPLNAATRGLVGAGLLAALPPHAVLVNVARAGVVDQAAVVAALRGRRLGAAWLDVTAPLPLPRFHPLRRAPNLRLTHYSAGQWAGRQAAAAEAFWAGVRALRDGRAPADLLPAAQDPATNSN